MARRTHEQTLEAHVEKNEGATQPLLFVFVFFNK